MSKNLTRRQKGYVTLAVEAFSIYGFCASLDLHHWSDAILCLSAVAGIPLWIYGTQRQVTCAGTKNNGERCTRTVTGMILGCQDHTWQSLLNRMHLGDGRSTWSPAHGHPRDSTAAHLPASAGGAVSPVPVNVVGDKTRDMIVFWATVLSAATGLVSAIVSVVSIS